LVDEGYQAGPKGSYRASSAENIILSIEQYDVTRIGICISGYVWYTSSYFTARIGRWRDMSV
jgi:hypothetical protein